VTERQGIEACIKIVKARQQYYECYRCSCLDRDPGNGHRPGCKGDPMSAEPATFATIEDILVHLEAHLERCTSAPALLSTDELDLLRSAVRYGMDSRQANSKKATACLDRVEAALKDVRGG